MPEPRTELLPDSKKYFSTISIGKYERPNPFDYSNFAITRVFQFPLPTELRDDTSVGYTSVNLETVGDVINNNGAAAGTLQAATLRNAGNVLNAGLSGTQRGLSGIGGVTEALGGGLVGIIQSLLPAEQISSAIQQRSGVAPNPNPSVQFQGPVLRDFSLTWVFYPKSAEESREIDKAIRILKGAALPSFNSGNRASILNYPYVCQLNFYPWDGTGDAYPPNNPYGWKKGSIIKIKKCFMAGVNANYHAFGTPAFFEGTTLPVTIQLTINFKEIEYLTAHEWDETRTLQEGQQFRAATVVKQVGGLLFSAAEQIATGVMSEFKDFIDDPGLTEEERARADATQTIIDGLTTPTDENNNESRITWTVEPTWFQSLGGANNADIVMSRNKDGEYVVTSSMTRTTLGGPEVGGGQSSIERSSIAFKTSAEAREYAQSLGVFSDRSTQTYPPPAAPAAPAQE